MMQRQPSTSLRSPLPASAPSEGTTFGVHGFSLTSISSLGEIQGENHMGCQGVNEFDKSEVRHDKFLVQHDMENMYTWAFKERPENALGKMQLWSYMNGHSRLVEPQFPFSVDRGFVRSHRMQHKQYQRSSNPQCVHGIRSPNLMVVGELDQKKWMELNFSIPDEASDFEAWRNLQTTEFELEKPLSQPKISPHPHPKKLLNGSSLNLSSQIHHSNSDVVNLSPICNKHRKNLFPHRMEEDFILSY